MRLLSMSGKVRTEKVESRGCRGAGRSINARKVRRRKASLESAVLSLQSPSYNMRFSTVFTLALPAVAVATAIPRDGGDCNTGSIVCCNSLQSVMLCCATRIITWLTCTRSFRLATPPPTFWQVSLVFPLVELLASSAVSPSTVSRSLVS